MRKRLKISMPHQVSGATLDQYLGKSRTQWGSWDIHFNDHVDEADAWVVIEGTDEKDNSCSVPEGSLFFATAEVVLSDDYYLKQSWKNYFLQFDHVLTSHPLLMENAHQSPPFLPWMVNANHGPTVFAPHHRDMFTLSSMQPVTKSKLISVICSTKAFTPGHTLRLRFVEKLVNKFDGIIDWYGNGIHSLNEKWDGLVDYKYSIAIENRIAPRIITEKIVDVFLAFTVPIYAGAPDIGKYFDSRGLLQLDMRDWRSSVELIDRVIHADSYHQQLPYVMENRKRALTEFHFIHRLVNEVEKLAPEGGVRSRRVVRNQKELISKIDRVKNSISWRLNALGNRMVN
jgi:hypothetical protein